MEEQKNGRIKFVIDGIEVQLNEGSLSGDFITQSFLNFQPDSKFKTTGVKEIKGQTSPLGGYYICDGEDFKHGGKFYTNAVLRIEWSLTLEMKKGYYDIAQHYIIIPDEIKLLAKQKTSAFDSQLGTYTWQEQSHSCKETLETIMNGHGEWYRSNSKIFDDVSQKTTLA